MQVRVACGPLKACRVDLEGAATAARLHGFETCPPRLLLVRGIGSGSLEQVIFRLGVLYALQGAGIPVCNPPRCIELTVDKAHCSLLLRRAGLPMPPTWACESPAAAQAVCRHELRAGHRLVCKPLFGAQGEGLCRIDDAAALPLPVTPGFTGVYYLQRYIEPVADAPRDLRVFVIDGRAVAAMSRESTHWITNRARGAVCRAVALDAELCRLAEAATAAVGADYAGVDLIPTRTGLQLLEVNSIPAWRGLQHSGAADVSNLLAHYLRGRLA